MATKVTYVLGAGASFEAVPVVAKVPERLKRFANIWDDGRVEETALSVFEAHSVKEPKSALESFKRDIIRLSNKISTRNSFDSLAREFWLNDNAQELSLLKNILSAFFIHEEATGGIDKRLRALITELIDSRSKRLRDNVFFISWNYDNQIERIFCDLFGNFNLRESTWDFGVFPIFSDNGEFLDQITPIKREHRVIKANGTYGYLPDYTMIDYSDSSFSIGMGNGRVGDDVEIYKVASSTIISQIVRFSPIINPRFKSNFNPLIFSFESMRPYDISGLIGKYANDTEVLVVIGYSFPAANQQIDSKILMSMKQLRKVFIQNPQAKQVAQDFKEARSDWRGRKGTGAGFKGEIEIIEREEKDSFVVPLEVYQ